MHVRMHAHACHCGTVPMARCQSTGHGRCRLCGHDRSCMADWSAPVSWAGRDHTLTRTSCRHTVLAPTGHDHTGKGRCGHTGRDRSLLGTGRNRTLADKLAPDSDTGHDRCGQTGRVGALTGTGPVQCQSHGPVTAGVRLWPCLAPSLRAPRRTTAAAHRSTQSSSAVSSSVMLSSGLRGAAALPRMSSASSSGRGNP